MATYARLLTDATSQAGSALQRRALARRRHEGRRLHVSFKLDTPTASFPYLTSSTTYQAIILPKDYSRPVREDAADHGRLQPRRVHPGRQRPLRPQPELVGRLGTARRRRCDARRGHGDHQRPDRRPARPAQQHRVREQPRAVQQLERPDLLGPGRHAPADPDARRPEERCSRTSASARRSRSRSTGRQIVKTLFNNFADLGNESPFAPVYPSTAKGPAAAQGPREGQGADRGRPASSRAGRRSSSPSRPQSSRSSPRSSSRRSSRSAATSRSRSSPAPSTTRAPRRRRRGSTSR